MKLVKSSILSLAVMLSGSYVANAQVKTPRPSPTQEIEQNIGLTEIEVEYSRPGVKDRKIFGGLVPYNKMWRTGANAATTVKFDDDVTLEGNKIEKGKYAMFTIPGKDKWTIVFNSNTDNNAWDYDESTEVLRFDVKPRSVTEKVESFTINFNNLRDASCTMELTWENTLVPIDITLNTDEMVMKNIDKAMAGPTAGDYLSAAQYYFKNGKDKKKALTWINKASEMEPGKYWIERWRAEILYANDMKKEAIKAAEESMKLAEEAGSDGYVKINKENIEKWK